MELMVAGGLEATVLRPFGLELHNIYVVSVGLMYLDLFPTGNG